MPAPTRGADGADPAGEGRPASPATTPVPPTPARPVVSIALVMFVPAVVLVLDGNLSVQTALMRFAAALLVSWVAARLVWATVQSARATGAGPARTARAARAGPGAGPGGAGTGARRPPPQHLPRVPRPSERPAGRSGNGLTRPVVDQDS